MIKTQGRQTQNLGSISRNHPPGGFHLSPNLVFFEEYTFLSDIYFSREEILIQGKKCQMSRRERVFSQNLEISLNEKRKRILSQNLESSRREREWFRKYYILRREREFFSQHLENRDKKENWKLHFFERERNYGVISSRDFSRSRLLSMTVFQRRLQNLWQSQIGGKARERLPG